ncbi:hypothetical protein [Runella sp.]|uniref:hypothetical protein n=1 Tax=Runella sp. TaxID=1960881 RepID=UPI003016CA5B
MKNTTTESFNSCRITFKSIIPLIILLNIAQSAYSQVTDNPKKSGHFSAAASVTNNGISFIPTFSLGKPAAIFDMSAGKKRLSFDPQLRFSLEGKPWSFLFWWRYKLVKTNKLALTLGAHPALNFRTETVSANGINKELTVARRYAAVELSPNYWVAKNISIGLYYLYSHGVDAGTVKNTHFITLNGNFSNIKISKQFFMRFTPLVYYLKQDAHEGFYASSTITFSRKNFPLSLSAIFNKTIRSNILGSKNFVWNVTLTYAFSKKYVEQS